MLVSAEAFRIAGEPALVGLVIGAVLGLFYLRVVFLGQRAGWIETTTRREGYGWVGCLVVASLLVVGFTALVALAIQEFKLGAP